MSSGILGTWNLYAGIPQAIYVNNNDKHSVVSFNICNRNYVDIRISAALSTSATSPTTSEYLEYEAIVLGKGSFERSGIIVGPGQYLVVESSSTNSSACCWGVEVGSQIENPIVITQNTGVAPAWVTAATLPDITSSGSTSITISAA